MAERLNAAVLKTVLVKANGGSNPSFSAKKINRLYACFFLQRGMRTRGSSRSAAKKVGEDMERLSSKIGSQLSISFLT